MNKYTVVLVDADALQRHDPQKITIKGVVAHTRAEAFARAGQLMHEPGRWLTNSIIEEVKE